MWNSKGEKNKNAKLTKAQVDKIRFIYSVSKKLGKKISQAEIGKRFGVGSTTISKIVRGAGWVEYEY